MKKEKMAISLYKIITLARDDYMTLGRTEEEALEEALLDAWLTKKDWNYIINTISKIDR